MALKEDLEKERVFKMQYYKNWKHFESLYQNLIGSIRREEKKDNKLQEELKDLKKKHSSSLKELSKLRLEVKSMKQELTITKEKNVRLNKENARLNKENERYSVYFKEWEELEF